MTSIGIDLGTTNSVLTRIERGKPVALPIDGSPIFPSVVMFDDGRVVAGREARNLELLHPDRTIRSVKRKMGTDHRYAVGDRMLSPEEISAEILRALCAAASAQLGEPVSDVVITVPAYFDDAQRRATLRAGEIAGLNVLRLLNEPTSASLCYEKTGAATGEEVVLVYDLGGGTFDVSVLEVFEGVREVRATAGNTRLGGDDFDDKLVHYFVDHCKRVHGVDPREDARAMVRLQRIAEETKIALSTDTRRTVREEFLMATSGHPVHLELEVTRRDFEEMIRPMLESTVVLARRALSDAKVEARALSRVCIVGGSTRIPMVRHLLREAFDAPIHEEIDPDLAVGLGAAMQAAMLRGEAVDHVLVDVAGHSLGIRTLGEALDGDSFAPVLARNTVLPASRAEEFYTVVDRQRKLEIVVLQGERSRASENTTVGSFMCELEPAPEGSPVRVELAYDLDGVVVVSVSQPGHDRVKTVSLSVADSGQKARSGISTAIERRAEALIGALQGALRDDLRGRLERVRAAAPEARVEAEDALLDFLVDHEPPGDGEDDEAV